MIDLAKEIWQTMCTNKLRTILTGISVAWGILMLILLLSISQGVYNMSKGFTSKNDPFRISVWAGTTSLPWKGLKEGRTIKLRARDMEEVAKSNTEYIASVEGNLRLTAQVSTNKDYLSSRVTGTFPEHFNGRYTLRQGRFLNQADLRDQRKVAVLNNKSASVLFNDTLNVIGKLIKVGTSAFTVVGVYSHEWEDDVYIPFSTAYALNGYNDNMWENQIHLKNVTNEEQSAKVEKEARNVYAKLQNFNPDDENAVYTHDRYASSIEQERSNRILTMAMWIIGILTLITGIVGVSNIMFVSVKERTHEIGIRRAIGAKPRKILGQIIAESIALTTIFGYLGIVFGVLAVEGIKYALRNATFPLRPDVDMMIAIEVLIALVIAGALAGIVPAIKATKVSPVEALRDE